MPSHNYVCGTVRGPALVQQLLAQGFQQDEHGHLNTADGRFTGVVVVDEHQLEGEEDDCKCPGWDELIEALHEIPALGQADLCREGGEPGDVEAYRYCAGSWYQLLQAEYYVREGTEEAALEAVAAALEPFRIPKEERPSITPRLESVGL